MNKEIAEIICNVFNRDGRPREQAAGPDERIRKREHEKVIPASNARRLAELERMIEIQSRLVRRVINNGDEEEYQPPPPRKPNLKLVR